MDVSAVPGKPGSTVNNSDDLPAVLADQYIELAVRCYDLVAAGRDRRRSPKFSCVLSSRSVGAREPKFVPLVQTEVVEAERSPLFVAKGYLGPLSGPAVVDALARCELQVQAFDAAALIGTAQTRLADVLAGHARPGRLPLLREHEAPRGARRLKSGGRGGGPLPLFSRRAVAGTVALVWDLAPPALVRPPADGGAAGRGGTVALEMALSEALQDALGNAPVLYVVSRSCPWGRWTPVVRSETVATRVRSSGAKYFVRRRLREEELTNGGDGRQIRVEMYGFDGAACRRLIGFATFAWGALRDIARGADYLRWVPGAMSNVRAGLQLVHLGAEAERTEVEFMFVKAESEKTFYAHPLISPGLFGDALKSVHPSEVESAASFLSRQLGLPNRDPKNHNEYPNGHGSYDDRIVRKGKQL